MIKHTSIMKLSLAAVAAGILTLNAMGGEKKEEKEETITIDQAPAAVQAAITKAAGDGKIEKIERETEDGKVVYEAVIARGDKKEEVEIDEQGKVIKVEKGDDDQGKDGEDKDEKGKSNERGEKGESNERGQKGEHEDND